MRDALIITGWGTVRPSEPALLPAGAARVAADFDPVARLGRAQARFLDRTTSLTLAACDEAVADAGLPIETAAERVGVTLGTSCGSVSGTAEFIRETFANKRPYMVNPIRFPNAVINCAASHAAIRLGARAVNTTVSGGRASGLVALRHAQLALRAGHADALLVGAVEEVTPENAWTAARGRPRPDDIPFGEAAAVLVVEREAVPRPGRRIWAEVLAVTVQMPRDTAADHAQVARSALAAAGVAPADVALVSVSGTGDPALDSVRRQGLSAVAGDRRRGEEIAGDCYSAMAAMQIADVLTMRRDHQRYAGLPVLVATADETGIVAMTVLRLSGVTEHDLP